jgi:hypothetical protein
MDKYVYIVAQLPALTFDKPSGMTVPLFLEEAEKWIGDRSCKKLQEAKLFSTTLPKRAPKTLQSVVAFEQQLRQDLAGWRESKRKKSEYKPETFSAATVKEGNPLEVEKKLLALRWQLIESMEQDHHFDLDILILYYLKLQILRKLSEYDKEKGLQRFKQISKVSE